MHQQGTGRLEWAIGIPGTVGGAVVGNAGAHGADIDGQFLAATIWEPGRGVFVYNREDMKYGYRDSVLKRDQFVGHARRVVLSAELQLKPEPTDVLAARAEGSTPTARSGNRAGPAPARCSRTRKTTMPAI